MTAALPLDAAPPAPAPETGAVLPLLGGRLPPPWFGLYFLIMLIIDFWLVFRGR